jgi:hypothetical protein
MCHVCEFSVVASEMAKKVHIFKKFFAPRGKGGGVSAKIIVRRPLDFPLRVLGLHLIMSSRLALMRARNLIFIIVFAAIKAAVITI